MEKKFKRTLKIGKELKGSLIDLIYQNHQKLKRISIPANITGISKFAFLGCNSLQKVWFSNNSKLITLPEGCFKDCTNLETIVIPKSIKKIESRAFENCTSIKKIIIPIGIRIHEDAFFGWEDDQIISSYDRLSLDNCAAILEDRSIVTTNNKKKDIRNSPYFLVTAKFGHVGRDYYVEKIFPVKAKSKKEASNKVTNLPRVKHHHKDRIFEVVQCDFDEYLAQIMINEEDIYFKTFNSSQRNTTDHNYKIRRNIDTSVKHNKALEGNQRRTKKSRDDKSISKRNENSISELEKKY